MAEFRLPDVGEGLHEAELLEWTVAVGDEVREGDVVAVVNTEKVTVELPSPVDGRVTELPWVVGDIIQVGEVLVRFDGAEAPTPAPATVAAPAAVVAAVVDAPAPSTIGTADLGQVIAAPSTRKLAADRGIDLRAVRGSGPGGRILRSDLDAPAAGPLPSSGQGSSATSRRKLTGLRALSARNLAHSRSVAITCTTTFEVHGDGLSSLLADLGDREPKVTVPAVVAVAAARALEQHPHLNGFLVGDGDELVLQDDVDVAVAVATPDGLTVPVVRAVQRRRLLDVAADLADLSTRAREGRLRAEELRGGTFTVSSTGGLERPGVLSTTPVINYPQITTLWVGRVQPAARVSAAGALEVGPVLRASLSFDHRFVDGAEATTFIASLSEALADPIGGLV